MVYYYEVQDGGRWTPRKTYREPIISKEMKRFTRNLKEISEDHVDLTLDELKKIYGGENS